MAAIDRTALGISASVGDIYDARRDEMSGLSIFKKAVPASCITVRDAPFTEVHLVHEDSYSEKFSKMNINAELSASFLGGLISFEGSGHYLSDKKTSARSVKSSLIYNIKTKEESLNIFHQDLKSCYSLDAIESEMGTHIVQDILWGANTILTSQYANKENKNTKEVQGMLSAKMEKFGAAVSGKGEDHFTDGDTDTGVKFEIQLFGDVLMPGEELPTTFEGALSLMKNMPSLVAKSNNGRGKPLSFRLIPISQVKNYLKVSIASDVILKSIVADSLLRVVQFFDQMTAGQQRLQDFYQDAKDFNYCVESVDSDKIETLMREVEIKQVMPKAMLAKTLTDMRTGKAEPTALDELLVKFQSNAISPGKVMKTLNEWKELTEKIAFAKNLVQKGVRYIGLGASFESEVMDNFEAKCVVLFFTKDSKTKDAVAWAENKRLFLGNLEQNRDGPNKYFAVDCDLQPSLAIEGASSCVQVIEKGQILIKNLLVEQEPDVTWTKASNGDVPEGAVVGGFDDGAPVYVARARHGGDLIPGKLNSIEKTMSIGWGGFEFKKSEYEVLCHVNIRWVRGYNGEVPAGALKGGYVNLGNTKETLYIGRQILWDNNAYIGKIQPSQRNFYYARKGQELDDHSYDALVPSWNKGK